MRLLVPVAYPDKCGIMGSKGWDGAADTQEAPIYGKKGRRYL